MARIIGHASLLQVVHARFYNCTFVDTIAELSIIVAIRNKLIGFTLVI